jgi:hypothetical protein
MPELEKEEVQADGALALHRSGESISDMATSLLW